MNNNYNAIATQLRTALLPGLLSALVVMFSSQTSQADPVYFAGTGHYYEVILVPQQITWEQAQAAATARGGYLATILSDAENSFVFNLVNDPSYWRQGGTNSLGPWIGGFQPSGSTEPDGGWTWVNGDGPFGAGSGAYTNWVPGALNDYGGIESWAHFFAFGNYNISAGWNDLSSCCEQPIAYVVEYDQRGGSATWETSPATGDWNTATNWTSGGPPNGPADTATFATSNQTAISLSAFQTVVSGIVFNSGASAFTISLQATAAMNSTLGISGIGITNNSGITQNFVAAGDASAGTYATTVFANSATAGSSTSFILNTNAAVNFYDTSTTGSATLIANGGLNAGLGGKFAFSGDSLGGTARAELFGNGTGDSTDGNLDISTHNAPGVTTGSIEGSGTVFLGANRLTVGANNLSAIFSGVIADGGSSGGTGGSLSKTGKGKLTLTNANTYTGGTTVTKGTLLAKNKTGSATGTGPVQVNTGTLEGIGKIDGVVTVGNGTAAGAILLAGNSATSPGTLTVNNAATFNSLSTYKCVFKRATTFKASKLTALGVTINSNATFTFLDTGIGTPAIGMVYTVINNTSANPIAGTFSNLANGSTFASNGNNFKVSYTGGNGNDLTLTVQ